MDSTSISPSAPASSPTGDWLTVLNDLRRSVSNLVLYVLECVPMAHTWPPANPTALPLSDSLPAMTPTTTAAAAQVPSTSLEEAIQSLAAQEPWTASWLPTDSALPPAAATAVPLPPKKSVPRKKKMTPVSQQQQQQQQQQQSQPPTPSMPIIDPYANHYAVTHPV